MSYVYWHLDANDEVLYIGCTMYVPNRMGMHRLRSPWWSLVERIVIDGPFENLAAARLYEEQLIAHEDPPYNVRWTTRDRRPLRLYRLPELKGPLRRPSLSPRETPQPLVLEPELSSSTYLARVGRAS